MSMFRKVLLGKIVAVVAAAAFLFAVSTQAQSKVDKKVFLKKFLDASHKIPASHRTLLSGGMQNFLELAKSLNEPHLKAGIRDDGGTFTGPTKSQLLNRARRNALIASSPTGFGGTIRVSNPTLDFVGSVMTGFTQSETSSAWCGNNIVAGYNDSGAYLRTALTNFDGPWSLSGVSVSANGGKTFIDLGYLNPGGDPLNFLIGDPVIACTSSSRFYYASIFATATPPDAQGFRNPISAVSINRSNSGGAVWGSPIVAAGKDGFTHSLDKPWFTVDPSNAMQLYVTYTDFDFSFPKTGTCANDARYAIELVSSSDGGSTWGKPVVIDEQCGASFNGVQGSNVAVSATGKVYVAYEYYPGAVPQNEIHITSSTNNGKTFSAPIKVSDVWPNGANGRLQGGFRSNEFPQLAIDRTAGPSHDTVYITWSDGINGIVPDMAVGTYAYADIVVASSKDGGATFSTPLVVSPTPASFTGNGRDQFMPGIAVDKDGTVAVCYYDRRADEDNSVIDRYCSVSHNHGASWLGHRASNANWVPAHHTDNTINTVYIGDYDAMTSDFLMLNSGFFGTFEVQDNGNPDVVGTKF
ncbi:MAG TPA: sialidase family protein [Candidatus Dormibacteraeota bacterium]|nr:sialidase family protein [Candidatus Dormibacteraeota bacterium]